MPADAALGLLAALALNEVRACVAGGWAVDALLGEQTRSHADLDLWVPAVDAEGLFSTFAEEGIDRIHPWPGDRPWNFVLHDGRTRRVDLHFYEHLDEDNLHYGSLADPFLFGRSDISGCGLIAGTALCCETPSFALRCRTGYQSRDIDRHDVHAICTKFSLPLPAGYEQTHTPRG